MPLRYKAVFFGLIAEEDFCKDFRYTLLGFPLMELRHLRYFVAVAEELSFTKGAHRLHVAQPALSRQIRDLEDEIGVHLLNRTNKHVQLTPEGRSFMADAKRVLAGTSEIVDSVRRLSQRSTCALNIGYVANLFYDVLSATLPLFRHFFPTVSVNLFDMTCGDQFDALAEGKIDVGFVGLSEPIQERGFQFQSVGSYETVAALAKTNQLAKKAVINLKDLEPMFFISLSETSYPSYHRWLTRTCRRVGFSPKILQQAHIEQTILQSIEDNLGVALLPEQVRKLPVPPDVVFRPIKPTVTTESSLAWKAENSSAALKDYVHLVRDYCASKLVRRSRTQVGHQNLRLRND
jgi:DNA-binding transcriptional LysR family regulator